jgi:hypothetical protein
VFVARRLSLFKNAEVADTIAGLPGPYPVFGKKVHSRSYSIFDLALTAFLAEVLGEGSRKERRF